MAEIRLQSLSKHFGRVKVLEELDLTVPDGEFMCLLGPSGTGKTMIINLIAGTADPTGGDILIGGRSVTHLEPRQRNVAVTFQSYALYPLLRVRDNLAFPLRSPLRAGEYSRLDVERLVQAVAELLELGDLLDRRPAELSGGQRQRVALGRMLVRQPDAYLMDEPLAHLDAQLRHRMRGELKHIQRERGVTTLYATPDQLEALSMGDWIAVMNWGGRVEQLGRRQELFEQPVNTFVASFTGNPPINLLAGRVEQGGTLTVLGATLPLPRTRNLLPRELTVGIRPHMVGLTEPAEAVVRGEVRLVERAGREVVVTLSVNGTELKAKQKANDVLPRVGDALGVQFSEQAMHLFDRTTGARLE
jgi:ABC-type sugar transport system ATPase subunit